MSDDVQPRLCGRGLHDLNDPANVRSSGYGCRPCQREARRAQRKANPEATRARRRAEYEANADKIRARSRAWYYANNERAIAAARRRVLANPEAVAERQRAYRAEHRAELAADKKAHHAKNRDRDLERSRLWYEANRDKSLAQARRWQVANADKVAAIQHRRRARVAGAVHVPYTVEETAVLVARHEGMCGYCRKRPAVALDHMIPIIVGGPDAIINLLPVCRNCNTSKGGRTPAAWLVARSRRTL